MDKISRTLGLCIGLYLINILSVMVAGGIASIFIKDFNGHLYTINFIGSLISLILFNSILSVNNNKVLNKDIFKKVEIKKILYIILFGFGLTIFMSMLSGLLTELIPNYRNAVNQTKPASESFIQLLIIIVLGPIYEEILHRRIIFEYLKKNYNIVLAVILQALVFGIFHGNIVQGIYTFIAGIPLALVYMYSKSLLGSIILHMVLNLMGNIIPDLAAIGPIVEIILITSAIVCLIFSIYKMTRSDGEVCVNS